MLEREGDNTLIASPTYMSTLIQEHSLIVRVNSDKEPHKPSLTNIFASSSSIAL
jgi:hypothetical protein